MIKFFKFIFHAMVLFLIVISLYPGSVLGYLFYGNLYLQPNLINNPFGTTINHFIYYFFVTFFGLCLHLRETSFHKVFYGLLFLSVILEILQQIVPHRAFQLYDLLANFAGVLVAYFLVKIYLIINKP